MNIVGFENEPEMEISEIVTEVTFQAWELLRSYGTRYGVGSEETSNNGALESYKMLGSVYLPRVRIDGRFSFSIDESMPYEEYDIPEVGLATLHMFDNHDTSTNTSSQAFTFFTEMSHFGATIEGYKPDDDYCYPISDNQTIMRLSQLLHHLKSVTRVQTLSDYNSVGYEQLNTTLTTEDIITFWNKNND